MRSKKNDGWSDEPEDGATGAYLKKIGGLGSSADDAQSNAPPAQEARRIASDIAGFTPEGLNLLYNKHLEEASRFYEEMAKSDPQGPEGWFGLAGVYFARRDARRAALCVGKVLEQNKNFPVIKELLKVDPLNCESMFITASELFHIRSYSEAVDLCDECMKCQVTPQSLYLKADALKKRAKKEREVLLLKSRGLSEVTRASESQRSLAVFFKLLSVLLLAGLGVGAYFIYNNVAADYFFNKGVKKYIEGYRGYEESKEGQFSSIDEIDPSEHLQEAAGHFKQALEIKKSYVPGHYLLLKTYRLAIDVEYGKMRFKKPRDEQFLREAEKGVKTEKKALNVYDPTGALSEKVKKKISDEMHEQ